MTQEQPTPALLQHNIYEGWNGVCAINYDCVYLETKVICSFIFEIFDGKIFTTKPELC
jgi:hypothetical protein